MIKFKSVKWKNFLSTGNAGTEIQLDRSYTTLIVGKNGDGKSTILDALCFGLFGKPFRDVRKGQLINSINQKSCLVEVDFSIAGTSYRIVRGMKPNKFEIWQNDQMLNQDAAARDYQKILEQQILKLNYKTFTQVVILGSASFVPFMQLSAHQRREVIEDILDIKIFSNMNQLLKEKAQQTKERLKDVEGKIAIRKAEIDSQEKVIASMVSSKQEQIDGIKQRISANEGSIAGNKEKIKELMDKVAVLQKDTTARDELIQSLDSFENELRKKSTKHYELGESIQFFTENNTCHMCEQDIPHDHSKGIVDKLSSTRDTVKSEISEFEQNVSDIQTQIKFIDGINTQISELNNEIYSLNTSNTTIEQQNDALRGDISHTNSDTDQINQEKSILKDMASEAVGMIKDKTDILNERNLQEVCSGLLKDTGIKTAIIREYLPAMNKLINMYLQAMDFYVKFELDESFNETIKSRYRDEFTYASFSEGEKMRIDLAILFTWRQIAKMKNSVNTNLLILDEIFDSSLDNAGTDYFLNVMSQLGEDSNVFVISHKGDQLFDKFRSVIKFEKKNDFSVIAKG